MELGISKGRLRGPDLIQPFRGVNVGARPLSLLDRAQALFAKLPDHARYSGPTAAALMGIPLPRHLEHPRVLDVAVPAPHRAPVGRGIRGHRYSDSESRLWHGVRISSPERTWCELAEVLALPDLIAAGDFLIARQLPFTTRSALEHAVITQASRRGIRTLRAATPLLDDRSESREESRLRVLLTLAGLRGLVANLRITTTEGYRYRADLAFPACMLLIEYQSAYHADVEQFRRDMTRRSRLEADGWMVMLVSADDLDDPAELARRVRRMLARRSVAG